MNPLQYESIIAHECGQIDDIYRSVRNSTLIDVPCYLKMLGEDAKSERNIVAAVSLMSHHNNRTGQTNPGRLRLLLMTGWSSSTFSDAHQNLIHDGVIEKTFIEGRKNYAWCAGIPGDTSSDSFPAFTTQSGLLAYIGIACQRFLLALWLKHGVAACDAIQDTGGMSDMTVLFGQRCRFEEWASPEAQKQLRFVAGDKLKRYMRNRADTLKKLYHFGLVMPTEDFLTGDVRPGVILIPNPVNPPAGFADFVLEKLIPKSKRYQEQDRLDQQMRMERASWHKVLTSSRPLDVNK